MVVGVRRRLVATWGSWLKEGRVHSTAGKEEEEGKKK